MFIKLKGGEKYELKFWQTNSISISHEKNPKNLQASRPTAFQDLEDLEDFKDFVVSRSVDDELKIFFN